MEIVNGIAIFWLAFTVLIISVFVVSGGRAFGKVFSYLEDHPGFTIFILFVISVLIAVGHYLLSKDC